MHRAQAGRGGRWLWELLVLAVERCRRPYGLAFAGPERTELLVAVNWQYGGLGVEHVWMPACGHMELKAAFSKCWEAW